MTVPLITRGKRSLLPTGGNTGRGTNPPAMSSLSTPFPAPSIHQQESYALSLSLSFIPLLFSVPSFPDTLQLRTERLITCTQTAPAWVVALLGGSTTSHVYETSYVSPTAKSVTMCSTNLTWNNVLSVREIVVYKPSTASSTSGHERTQLNQYAEITALCGGIKKVKAKIEEASVERFEQNAQRGREGFKTVLEMSRRVFGEEREEQRKAQLA